MSGWITLFVVMLAARSAWANDRAVVGRGGTWEALSGEHVSIRMVAEKVRIDIYR